jgi:hypothetical protein
MVREAAPVVLRQESQITISVSTPGENCVFQDRHERFRNECDLRCGRDKRYSTTNGVKFRKAASGCEGQDKLANDSMPFKGPDFRVVNEYRHRPRH